MDIRIEKTKTAIHNTFLELRSKKPLEKITIKELCEKAQINKSTFYSHYKDIYDLYDAYEKDIFKPMSLPPSLKPYQIRKTVWKIPPFWLKICFSAISPGIPSSGSCFPEPEPENWYAKSNIN